MGSWSLQCVVVGILCSCELHFHSGSMGYHDKLPLVKKSMSLLLSRLQPEDSVAIVVYAGAAGVVLPPTKVRDKAKILQAMNSLAAGGSTAGAQGIQLAYQLARENFV